MAHILKILIIDDDQGQCATLEDILQLHGYLADSAGSGFAAMALFEKYFYDLALVDIQLGDMTGPDLVTILIGLSPKTEFIYMTGHASLDTAVAAVRQKQVISYEEKPLQLERLLSYINQIARRKQIECGLALSKKRFQQLTAMSPAGIYEINREGLFSYVNERWCGMIQTGEDDILGEDLLHGIAPSDHATVAKAWQELMRGTKKELQLEFRCERCKDGSLFWVHDEVTSLLDANDVVTSFIGTRLDITRQKEQAEHLLLRKDELEEVVRQRTTDLQETLTAKNEAQHTLETLFQSIPDGILSVDKNMYVQAKNDFPLRGVSSPLRVGQKIDPAQSELCAEIHTALLHTLTTKQPIRELRIECFDDTHKATPLMLNTSLVQDREGTVSGALLIARDISQLVDLEKIVYSDRTSPNIIGASPAMKEIFSMLDLLADKETTVLVTGESGTGKGLLVETLHKISSRSHHPLVTVNCSALPEDLLESELFGHVAGAFTGAIKDRIGRVEAATGGILFLDEIGDLSSHMQLKLLRFIETKEYERVGESTTRSADLRLVAATNIDLERQVKEGRFRKDFYYRLKVMKINIPPLRERTEDIPPLIDHFIDYFSHHFNKEISSITPEALQSCISYHWPGNIRELRHAIEHACIVAKKPILKRCDMPFEESLSSPPPQTNRRPAMQSEKDSRRLSAKDELLTALKQTDWNVAKAARILRIGRTTIYQQIKEYSLTRDQYRPR